MKGHLYIIRSEEGPIKIGISTEPEKRIAAITHASGRYIVEQYISPPMERYAYVEKYLHAQFEDRRRRGEWFDVPFDEAVSKLKKVGVALCSDEWRLSEDYVRGSIAKDRLVRFMQDHPDATERELSAYFAGAGDSFVADVEFALACDLACTKSMLTDVFDRLGGDSVADEMLTIAWDRLVGPNVPITTITLS